MLIEGLDEDGCIYVNRRCIWMSVHIWSQDLIMGTIPSTLEYKLLNVSCCLVHSVLEGHLSFLKQLEARPLESISAW